MHAQTYTFPETMETGFLFKFGNEVLEMSGPAILDHIARAVAERYVAEHYPQLIARMDPQAIANLAIAESAKAVSLSVSQSVESLTRRLRQAFERER